MWTRWESEYDAEAAYTVLTPKRRETAMLKDGGAGGGAIDDDDEEDDAGAGGAEAGAAEHAQCAGRCRHREDHREPRRHFGFEFIVLWMELGFVCEIEFTDSPD